MPESQLWFEVWPLMMRPFLAEQPMKMKVSVMIA
jgi:hypothetical protein